MPNGFCSEKSIIESAAVSISKLSANGSLSGVLSSVLRGLEAPEVDPTTVSPTLKVPSTLATSRTPVVEFQVLTLAVVLVADPVITSLNAKSPVPPDPGDSIVIVGVRTYLFPESVISILETFPAPLILTTPLAVATPTTSSI